MAANLWQGLRLAVCSAPDFTGSYSHQPEKVRTGDFLAPVRPKQRRCENTVKFTLCLLHIQVLTIWKKNGQEKNKALELKTRELSKNTINNIKQWKHQIIRKKSRSNKNKKYLLKHFYLFCKMACRVLTGVGASSPSHQASWSLCSDVNTFGSRISRVGGDLISATWTSPPPPGNSRCLRGCWQINIAFLQSRAHHRASVNGQFRSTRSRKRQLRLFKAGLSGV